MMVMAEPSQRSFSPRERAAEKQRSRDEDAAALASGRKSAADIERENGALVRVLVRGRIDLRASKSLG
jgi:hypothetical protein